MCEKDDSCIIPSSDTKYFCNVLLEIQSVFHSTEDKDKDVIYYLQVLSEQHYYDFFVDTRKIDTHLKRTNKPKPESESEEEINEDTVFDE